MTRTTTQTPTAPAVRTLRVRSLLGTAVTGVVATVVLAACGGGSGGTTTAESTTSGPSTGTGTATASSPAPGQGGPSGGGPGGADFQKIRECLTAAGISVPTGTGRFTGSPPAGATPGGTPPSGGLGPLTPGADGKYTAPNGQVFTAPPTRGPGDGGGFGQIFSDPNAQAALTACGLSLPTGGPRPGGTPTTTG